MTRQLNRYRRLRMGSIPGVVVVLVAVLMATGCASVLDELAGEPDPPPVATPEPASEPTGPAPGTVDSPAPTTSTDREAVTVTWVLDGDTFRVRPEDGDGQGREETIRLLGINAPEADECGGQESLDFAIDLVGRNLVTLERHGYDEFGRTLGVVWLDSGLVNEELVTAGHAVARATFDHPYSALLDTAEDTAKANRVGVWSVGCRDESTGLAINSVQADAAGRDDENPNGEWVIVENRSDASVALDGWSIRDESTRHRFSFPDGLRLATGEQVEVRSGCAEADDPATIGPNVLHWCDADGPVWSNGGDTAFLLTPDGAIADSLSWQSVYAHR